MAVALLVSRLALAAVFAAAGTAKLADRDGAQKAALDFGAPRRLAAPLAVALPVAELGVAILLLLAGSARAAAVGAVALLVLFSAAIAVAVLRGRAPDCHCFGQLHSEPAGWKALARNALLAALAVFVVVAGRNDAGPGAVGWIGRLGGAELATLVLAVVV